MGQLFWGFSKFQTPRCRHGATPKYGRLKLEFPEIAQNHDSGGSMVSSGSLEIGLKNDGVTAPMARLENARGE